MRETFALTFRGTSVHWLGNYAKRSTTSIRPDLYFVLTYPVRDGQPATIPQIAAAYGTVQTAREEIRNREDLRSYEGQSFIIRALPGTTEVVEAEVVPNTKTGARR